MQACPDVYYFLYLSVGNNSKEESNLRVYLTSRKNWKICKSLNFFKQCTEIQRDGVNLWCKFLPGQLYVEKYACVRVCESFRYNSSSMSSEQHLKDPTHVVDFTRLTFWNTVTHKIKSDVQVIMRTSIKKTQRGGLGFLKGRPGPRVHAREAKRGIGGVTVSWEKRLSVEREEVGRQGPGAE